MFYAILAVLAYLSYLVFEPFLAALAWAIVLVVVFYPLHERLARRWGRTPAAVASTTAVTLILIVPTFLIMGAFVHQGVSAVEEIQRGVSGGHFQWVNLLWDKIQQRFPEASPGDLATTLHHYAEMAAGYIATRLGAVLR